MSSKIAVFGGSFNPPGVHHIAIARILAEQFGRVEIIPCGPRSDKPTVNDVNTTHRAALVQHAFVGIPGVHLDFSDLEEQSFTRTYDLDRYLHAEGEPWHAVGSDLVCGGGRGESVIQREWYRGEEVWRTCRFVVIAREGSPIDSVDLPPHHLLITPPFSGSSTEIRERVFNHRPITGLVTPHTELYIERHRLYTGLWHLEQPSRLLPGGDLRVLAVADQWSDRAKMLAEELASVVHVSEHDPHAVVVFGGDGTMLAATEKYWPLRVPFVGIGTGNRCFLMHKAPERITPAFFAELFDVRQSPLLVADMWNLNGDKKTGLSTNDVWIERSARRQAAWVRIKVNGAERIPLLVGDGALVATALGSTAYARAMGANPLPAGSRHLVLVGNNPDSPLGWRASYPDIADTIEFENADPLRPGKRPLYGVTGTAEMDSLERMVVRASPVAAVEIALPLGYDLMTKLARLETTTAGEHQ